MIIFFAFYYIHMSLSGKNANPYLAYSLLWQSVIGGGGGLVFGGGGGGVVALKIAQQGHQAFTVRNAIK